VSSGRRGDDWQPSRGGMQPGRGSQSQFGGGGGGWAAGRQSASGDGISGRLQNGRPLGVGVGQTFGRPGLVGRPAQRRSVANYGQTTYREAPEQLDNVELEDPQGRAAWQEEVRRRNSRDAFSRARLELPPQRTTAEYEDYWLQGGRQYRRDTLASLRRQSNDRGSNIRWEAEQQAEQREWQAEVQRRNSRDAFARASLDIQQPAYNEVEAATPWLAEGGRRHQQDGAGHHEVWVH